MSDRTYWDAQRDLDDETQRDLERHELEAFGRGGVPKCLATDHRFHQVRGFRYKGLLFCSKCGDTRRIRS